jgi:predicted phage gp36 major capsid-like protein
MFFALLLIGTLCMALGSPLWAAGGGTATLEDEVDTLKGAIDAATESMKAIGGKLETVDKSLSDKDTKIEAVNKSLLDTKNELADVKKKLDDHMKSTLEALKAVTYAGGRGRQPVPWSTRPAGERGVRFNDIEECKALGYLIAAHCHREDSVKSFAMKALERRAKEDQFFELAFKAMSERDNGAGGVLVPGAVANTILMNIADWGAFEKNAGILPMTAPSILIPECLTGLTIYYPEENANITPSDATFGDKMATARLYATLAKWSNSLDEDSLVAFSSMMAELIVARTPRPATGTGSWVRDEHVRSNGRGVQRSEHRDARSRQRGGRNRDQQGKDTFQELAYGDFVAAQGLIATKYRAGAKWYMHRVVEAIARGLVSTTGQPLLQYGMTPDGSRLTTILGDPVVLSDALPYATAVTTPFILYGNLRAGMGFGQHRTLRIENSKEAGFAADQTWVRSTARVAIAPVAGSSTLPTMVKLVTSTT